ncbi:MAG: ABC transporter ATP-binding protein [Polyangiales bacterium]
MARSARIVIDGLHKQYGEREVLQGIDLEIAPGEFVALVGRSGTGKSTLLRILCGLEQPTRGSVKMLAADGSESPGEVRVVFQEPRLLPWRSVLDNVRLGLPRSDGVRDVLQRVGLADRAGDYPHTLSGGQRQRVALARALVHEPSLMLFDEPFGALDALTRMAAQQLVESLWLRQRFSAVLVTHDVEEAVLLADRALVIDGGQIIERVTIDLPRPRERTDPQVVQSRAVLLAAILGRAATHEPTPPGRESDSDAGAPHTTGVPALSRVP